MSEINSMSKTPSMRKPLLTSLVNVYMPYVVPFGSSLNAFYYLLYGPTIIQLLDYYHVVYKSKNMMALFFLLAISQCVLSVWCFQSTIFHSSRFDFLRLYSVYFMSAHDYLIWAILSYHKYGTYRLLVDLRDYLHKSMANINNEEFNIVVLQKIRLLSKQNIKINRLMSLLIMNYLILNGTYCLLALSSSLLNSANIRYFLYISLSFISLAHSIYFCCVIDQTLTNINYLFSEYQWKFANRKHLLSVQQSTTNETGKLLFFISVYRKDFSLKIFDCFTMDFDFFKNLLLFIMLYSVIIIQTN